jgi:3-dehydroquinate dehydratase I
MFCTSINEDGVKNCLAALQDESFAEIRIDLIKPSPEQVDIIFSKPLKLIATCRPDEYDNDKRLDILKKAIRAGAVFVDLEIESEAGFKNDLIRVAKESHCQVILSYHNFERTPDIKTLRVVVDDCFRAGADIAKIACQVNSNSDAAKILALYEINQPLIAIGMGELGKITRVAAPYLGAPFTFVSKSDKKLTAPGQLNKETMEKISQLIDKKNT